MGRKREGARDEITRLSLRFVSTHHGSVLGCFCCFQVEKPQRSDAIPAELLGAGGAWAGGSARVCVAPRSPAARGMQHPRPPVTGASAPEASRCAREGLGVGKGCGLGRVGTAPAAIAGNSVCYPSSSPLGCLVPQILVGSLRGQDQDPITCKCNIYLSCLFERETTFVMIASPSN